jgi:hypothetical protein
MTLTNAIVKRGREFVLVLLMWAFWAVVRIFLFLDPHYYLSSSLFIKEPLNTILFFVTGPILLAIYFVIRRLPEREPARKSNRGGRSRR